MPLQYKNPSKSEVEAMNDFVDVLGQTKWWKRASGYVVRRRDMHINYKLNALGWLLRNSKSIVSKYAAQSAFYGAPDSVQAELDAMSREPEAWMMDQPLFRALLKDVMKFAKVRPEEIGMIEPSIQSRGIWVEP